MGSVPFPSVPQTHSEPPEAADNPYRLPRSVVPRRYDLTLEPDLSAATFAGSEAVAVEVVEPTDVVVLNALDLEIDEAAAEVGGERLVATVTLDAESERATLEFERLSDRVRSSLRPHGWSRHVPCYSWLSNEAR